MVKSKLPRPPMTKEFAAINVVKEVEKPRTELHVDEWLDTPIFMLPEIKNSKRFTEEKKKAITYARYKLEALRLPAYKIMEFSEIIKTHKVYCSYLGEMYKLTFASRMGLIGLRKDFTLDHGYDVVCYPSDVDWWSDKPEVPDYYTKEQLINKVIKAKKE